jgi:competence protein ComEC
MRLGLISCLLFMFSMPLQAARLVVMDVGEGQALFVQQGDEAMLIDTGHAGMASRVLQRLHHYGVKSLHGIILTHLHPDHASGYFRIREAYPQAPVLESGQPLAKNVAPDMVRWVRDALRADPRLRVIGAGDHLDWGELRIDVLWPQCFSSDNLNLHSLVLLLRLGESRVLIMGDAPQAVERQLLALGVLPKQIDVLVVGHHAAADSSDREVLRHLAPRFSIISVNAHNLRGYPDADTIKRLEANSGRLYRTDRDGEVCLRLSTRRDEVGPCP